MDRMRRAVVGQRLIEIIDFEKDHLAVGFKRPKVVLFVRVVGVAEMYASGEHHGVWGFVGRCRFAQAASAATFLGRQFQGSSS